jgi:hypothetical protein
MIDPSYSTNAKKTAQTLLSPILDKRFGWIIYLDEGHPNDAHRREKRSGKRPFPKSLTAFQDA